MKTTLNWMKEYTPINLSVDELVQKIGAQLGAVEEVENLGDKYKGIIVAKIEACESHPGADRLKVCRINDGGVTGSIARDKDGLIQVVCGAPNVAAGQTVAWLPPGTILPSSAEKEPLELKARDIRGVVSNGMIASAHELGISDDHRGILVLDDAKPGTDFAETAGLNDYVIDIENKMFTHRPDAFGILGIAREVAGIQHKAFHSPDWYVKRAALAEANDLPLTLKNELPKLVPRFVAVAMKNVDVKTSPVWLQVALSKVGIKAINNVVDVTNYLMHLTGQPLHAYDYDKVAERSGAGAVIVVRHPRQGENVKLLNGKTIEPVPTTIMIATDKELIGVGGVMGGADTEVDENTKNIILEVANFDMYAIRRASMAHGLFTDAATRFTKGPSPAQNDLVAVKAMAMLKEIAGADQASKVHDPGFDEPFNWWAGINVSVKFINDRLGLTLKGEEIKRLLENVEFKVQHDGDKFTIAAPSWRTDISIPEDIVEEVGRLYGYDQLPLQLPKRVMTPVAPEEMLRFKSQLRNLLAGFGANELLTHSFVHAELIERSGQKPELAFKLSNALSPELQHYRMSLMPSLLAKIHSNVKAGYDEFALFEIGKSHNRLHKDDDNGVPKEYDMLACVYANKAKNAPPAYYEALEYLDELGSALGIEIEYKPIEKELKIPVVGPFEAQRSALAYASGTDIVLGVLGEYKASVRSSLKLPPASAGFEIGIKELLASTTRRGAYMRLSRFPSISQDICLQVASKLSYGELTQKVTSEVKSQLDKDMKVEIEPVDIYESEELGSKKRITYHVKLTSYNRTLTEGLLSSLLAKTAEQLKSSISTERI